MVAAIEIRLATRRWSDQLGQGELGAERLRRKGRLSRLEPGERHRAQAAPSGKLIVSSIAGFSANGQRRAPLGSRVNLPSLRMAPQPLKVAFSAAKQPSLYVATTSPAHSPLA